ncbi:MAG: uroporphyrinogen decarboxylase [Verrucomicrobia bacterium]|nr:uroporphyrinogen decarboxylase [Verrucomicrobiota bacterium]
MNDLFLKALGCNPVPRPPVWLMRQAGRYMPQYRALREKHSLWEMFHHPDIAAAVTRQPLEYLGVDAAILFSDILVIAEALGLTVQFPDKGGPRVEPAIHTAAQVAALPYIPVSDSLHYVFETIRLVKGSIDVPLIGFSGAPFTVASYFIDSSSHHSFERTKRWIKEDPQSFHALLARITEATIAYLKEQVKAGVDALQVFDSWASVLDDAEFEVFCAPYLLQIVDALKETGVPVILFCRSSSLRSDALSKIRPAGISFDWHLPMKELRQKVPAGIAVQGNFNPEFLKLSQSEIQLGVKELLTSMHGEKGFIVNLGHGVTPDIPFENVRCFVEAVKQSST